MYPSLEDICLRNKRVFLRSDFNVPLRNGAIADDTRLVQGLPTLNYILSQGASVVVCSHLGRPRVAFDSSFSLRPVFNYLKQHLGDYSVHFAPEGINQNSLQSARHLRPGEVLLLDNVRFYKEETQNDSDFAALLARHGQVYVNDAFGTAHRSHASTTGCVPLFKERAMGLLLAQEIKQITRLIDTKALSSIGILGGAKVSDKIGLIDALLQEMSVLLIGGAMANTFLAAKHLGANVSLGSSLVEEDKIDIAQNILVRAKRMGKSIVLPLDCVVGDALAAYVKHIIADPLHLEAPWRALDIGPKTVALFCTYINKARRILWNGPLGAYEWDPFAKGSIEIAKSVAQATQNGAFSLIGGGDSIALIKQNNLETHISHISTGGGALLSFLENKTLAALDALKHVND